jgi:hypothetical protein
LNRQIVQANKNFASGDMRVAQTLYGVILSHLKSDATERPEKNTLKNFVTDRIRQILSPKLEAIKDSDNPEEVLSELLHNLDANQKT